MKLIKMGYLKDSIHQVFYLSFFTPLCGSVTSTSNSGAPHASDGQRGDTPVEQSSRTRPGNTPELRRISACRTPPQVALASAPTVVARPVYCTDLGGHHCGRHSRVADRFLHASFWPVISDCRFHLTLGAGERDIWP